MKNIQITQWCAHFIELQVHPGDICIDATMGKGNDTLLLSRLCGERGRVYAFDIQAGALFHTRNRLVREDAPKNYTLLLESHVHMDFYAAPQSVSCIVFNLGYLPGGDHTLATRASSTLEALKKALLLLKKGGLLSLCIYSGGDSGFEERDQVLAFLKTLNPREYLVIKSDYYNRPSNPPIPVQVIRL